MSRKPPSQIHVLLLLAASLVAGLIVSTSLGRREVARQDDPSPLNPQPLVAETP
jgi:hypothetical protein